MYKLSQQLQLYSETLQCNTLLHTHRAFRSYLHKSVFIWQSLSRRRRYM